MLGGMLAASLPLWQSFNLDPDYYYLLNGLRLVEGLAPVDVSHPGTPVQVLIAAVIRLLHPVAETGAVVDAVLADPEPPLIVAALTIHLLVGIGLWLLGRAAYATCGGLMPALLAQAAPFVTRIVAKSALHPKPEPLLLRAVCLLAAVALAAARETRAGDRHAVLAGVAMGFGIACKIHFAALGLVPLLLFDRRRLVLYAGTSVAAFLAFVAPAMPSWEIWVDWLRRIALSSGAYGEGAQTVIDPGRYPRAVLRLFTGRPAMSAGIVASLLVLVAYVRLRRRGLLAQDRRVRLLAGIVLGQVAVVLSTAKQPVAHYLIPALALTGPALAILWAMTRPLLPAAAHLWGWRAAAAGVAVGVGVSAVAQTLQLAGWSRAAASIPMSRFDGCAKVYFDAASAPSYAFLRADLNAHGRYSARLSARFPADEYAWFIFDHTWWKKGVMQWGRRLDLAEVLDAHSCVVFRGNQIWLLETLNRTQAFAPDDMCIAGEERIYTRGVDCRGQKK
ncbi:MAG: hypothetical protein HY985_15555 [Magnetospirillum sp.]|nr:hypothetical protein [Magnetospirillum sp.]